MDIEKITDYCLSKKGAYIDFPFGPFPACIKVCNKIFVQIYWTDDKKMITLKCDAINGQRYRNEYPDAVTRGYHCPRVQQPYWNTVYFNSVVPDDELLKMIDHAYNVVVGKLSKDDKESLSSG
jgi:predicted DNA-binding protein (MmcQ/YjbR family)